MKIPGFTAEASLHRSGGHYFAGELGGRRGVTPQLSIGLTSGQLEWCRLACAYCHYYGVFCWPCYYCGWIIVLGG